MRKLLLAISVCLGFSSIVLAQNERCGTELMFDRYANRNPFLREARSNFDALLTEEMIELRSNRDGEIEAVLVIPVVFHIIHLNGPENISDEQIYNQMEIINRDYRKLNADTAIVVPGLDTLISDIKLEFRLATKDFLGNCTNGIERIYSIEALVGDNGSKLNQWPRERYLNVWTVATMEDGVAGYSQYPSSVIDEFMARADGIIIRHQYIGDIGTGSAGNSRALTHEAGHWLNLSHPWGDTNEPGVECGDDAVSDTPITEGFSNCVLDDYSCSSTDFDGMIYSFDGVNAGMGGTTDPTVAPKDSLEGENFARVTTSQFLASGVSANSVQSDEFAFSSWSTGGVDQSSSYADMTGAINTADYYEFTVTPRAGSAMTLTGFKFNVRRSATGPRNFAVRSDVNNYGTNLNATVSPASSLLSSLSLPVHTFFFSQDSTAVIPGATITLSGGQFQNVIEPIKFRIYAWNAEDGLGFFSVDDLEISGDFGVVENAQNFMDYSYCSVMFTEGQKERMRTALASSISGRNFLYTDLNRSLTGTDDNPLTCAPNADFYPASKFACLGDEVDFVDNSTNGEVDSWLWTFEDGNPATSTEENPEVVFTSFGRKSVTLTVTNEQGSTTKTIDDVVVIAPDNTEFPGSNLIQDGFDSPDQFWNMWVGENYDNNMSSWQQTSEAGFSGNTSARLNAFNMDVTLIDEGGNDIDELVSPHMDLSNVEEDCEVTFRWSFATQSIDLTGITDRLSVYISNDCGKTWQGTPRITISGADLVTSGNSSISYVPTSSDQWAQESFTVPSSFYGDGFRFKFVFFAGLYPNNLYIDDVNMTAVTAVDEATADFYGAKLFPNPAEEMTTLAYSNNATSALNITLTDMSGRIVQSWTPNTNAPGRQTIQINTSELAKGVYTVNLTSERNTSTLKLMVN